MRSTSRSLPFSDWQAVFDLVRLPAVLSVPGDSLAGAAFSDSMSIARAVGLTAASSSLYLAGMSLNDYADRELDAAERPTRPIPSGRVEPRFALQLAATLTAAGVGIASVCAGRQGAISASALAGSVWAYDLVLKSTSAGPLAMAACRSLDVMLGASGASTKKAVPAAAIIGAHTLVLTTVSRNEVDGGSPNVPRRARAATYLIAAAAASASFRSAKTAQVSGRGLIRSIATTGLLAVYTKPLVNAQSDAIEDPVPSKLQRVVGVSIQALMPLQASLLASRGKFFSAALVASGWPIARRFSRKRAVT